jgi:hypothetical protein
MEYAIGLVLALVVSSFARLVGFDRDRSFYPVLLVVIASYLLVAVMGGSVRALILESVVMSGFVVVAVIGVKNLGPGQR